MIVSGKPVNVDRDNWEIGMASTRGGIVTLDQYFKVNNTKPAELSTYLCLASGGDLFVEGADGSINPYLGRPDGDILPVIGARVLSSCVINGTTYTTSASGITWHGGK